ARFLGETKAKCVLVGARPGQFPTLNAEYLPWNEATESDLLARLSVGLCPLADTSWNRGKSGYKIIQYMAAARRTLASPVGIAADLVTEGDTGFRCVTADDWYNTLMRLYHDRARCASMGAHAQQIAARKYDTAVVAAQLYDLFVTATKSSAAS